jgi:hypothetical protein
MRSTGAADHGKCEGRRYASGQWQSQSLSVPKNKSADFNRDVAAGELSQR